MYNKCIDICSILDLITGIVDASVNATERSLGIDVLNYWWFGGDFLCKLQRTFSSISLLSSNFILAVTSIDRALVVAKPMIHFKRGLLCPVSFYKLFVAICIFTIS